MKFGVIIFPGSNCDKDLIHVLSKYTEQKVEELWHKDTDLKGVDFVFLPGGFSYGDYLRSGALAKLSPIMKSVIEFANNGGFVMGICNGFQILCESGLLPGALLRNEKQKFSCKNVYLKPINTTSIISTNLKNKTAICIPVAHGEGRYYADDITLEQLINNDQIIFKYCTKEGEVTDSSNPNGSLLNIAGICNSNKNVFGMMPHPERCADDFLFNSDGTFIFESLFQYQKLASLA